MKTCLAEISVGFLFSQKSFRKYYIVSDNAECYETYAKDVANFLEFFRSTEF